MNTALKLYEIAPEFAALVEQDELTDQDMERLDELGHAIEVKADNIAALNDNMTVFIEMCKSEEKRIADKRRAVENRIKWMKQYLKNCMETAGVMEVEVGTRKIALQKNPPKMIIEEEGQIPSNFFNLIPEQWELDKKMLKDALKKESIPGARLEQELSVRFK
jgi:hypothetical protein